MRASLHTSEVREARDVLREAAALLSGDVSSYATTYIPTEQIRLVTGRAIAALEALEDKMYTEENGKRRIAKHPTEAPFLHGMSDEDYDGVGVVQEIID